MKAKSVFHRVPGLPARRVRERGVSNRGVSSVLAMMMAVLVGSLAAAMAVVTQGNVRSAATHIHVMRSMNAAETGMLVAESRLWLATRRFTVERSDVDAGFAQRLWNGGVAVSDGEVVVGPTLEGNDEPGVPSGIAEAVGYLHAADSNTVEFQGISGVTVGPAPAGADMDEYLATGWVTTPAITLQPGEGDVPAAAFQITYAPLRNEPAIRAFVTGIDIDPMRPGLPITRVISRDFRIAKRVDHAVMSRTRMLIGKNVMIEGDLATSFDRVNFANANPLVLRSDFRGLSADLNARLDTLYAQIAIYDVDGDNRLRVDHPIEGQGLSSGGDNLNEIDYDGDGEGDGAYLDATGDGYVDEFDLFVNMYDDNGDGRIALGGDLAAGTPAAGFSSEFDGDDGLLDEDLAYLIDNSNPDRNRNGVYGFIDDNGNGRWDPADETALDYDDYHGVYADQVLGWRDGFIDRRDLYAKVGGRLVFAVSAADWAGAQGDFYSDLLGPIRPGDGDAPLTFNGDDLIPDIGPDEFADTQLGLQAAADGDPFWDQVAANLGVSLSALATYVEAGTDPEAPMYRRVDPDTDGDGLPENHLDAYFESMPFGAPNPVDWYFRPVFENMNFHDVRIPRGVNGLFINCTFAGATYIQTEVDNSHPNWTLYGKINRVGGALEPAGEPLDKSDFDRYTTGNFADGPANYDDFPDPPSIDGVTVTGTDRDTKMYSNNIRFHDCLMVGSVVSDVPQVYTHVRNKVQFTGSTRFAQEHPTAPDDPDLNPDPADMAEIAKSSLMLPHYSVDIGTFNSPPEQNVQLVGAIIAGVLDIRGNAEINGAMLLTFDPVPGEAPMVDTFGTPIGNPGDFNTSLGYFGPEDGDTESLDPATLPIVNGVPIVGWDLDGDGIADLGPDEPPTQAQIDAGAMAVPFNGYGRIRIAFNPDMVMPDGLMLPLSALPVRGSYTEGMHP